MKIFVADIGGTNSRFAYFKVDNKGNLYLLDSIWLKTSQANSFAELIELLYSTHFSMRLEACDISVLAVPGLIIDKSYCEPPNITWNINLSNIKAVLGVRNCLLINDFVAQAYACCTHAVSSVQSIKSGKIDPKGTIAVIGAGTGLGQCALIQNGYNRFLAVPSEGAHAAFAFSGKEEFEYEYFVMKMTGKPYCYCDLIVSGIGLSLLHQFLTGKSLTPFEVSTELNLNSKTLKWFAKFLGRVCRNYALTILALGGIYISGGITAKNPILVKNNFFINEFCFSPTYSDLLVSIPIFLNDNENSGLYGAAFYGQLTLCK